MDGVARGGSRARAAATVGLLIGLVAAGAGAPSRSGASPSGPRLTAGSVAHDAVLPPGTNGNPVNRLDGVSCFGPSDCVAVGSGGNPPQFSQTVTEAWNGTSWAVVPSPSPGALANQLLGVSCTGPTFCVAAGSTASGFDYQSGGPATQTLVELWNGRSWSVMPSPNVADSIDQFAGVSCTSPTFCMAVGTWWPLDLPFQFKLLVASWNGTAWSILPADGPAEGGYLTGVDCVTAAACTAVGTSNFGETLVLSWDGHAWADAPSLPASRRPLLSVRAGFGAISRTCPAFLGITGWGRQGSNLRPRDYESPALTTELRPLRATVTERWAAGRPVVGSDEQ